MTESAVPFHLRPNKSVDRALFIDMLLRVGLTFPLKNYVYMSMGGAFLQDHVLAHRQLGIPNLLSIDDEAWTVKRQNFNKPFKSIVCEEMSAADFVQNFETVAARYESNNRFIIWLDYMKPGDRGVQLSQVRTLGPNLAPGDVLKVTLNANPNAVKHVSGSTPEERAQERYNALLGQINTYFPLTYKPKDVEERLPALLGDAFKIAVTGGMSRRNTFLPLSAFSYSDGQPMATYTGIVLNAGEEEKFLLNSSLRDWPYRSTEFSDVKFVEVPHLSVREKTEIDRLIASNADEIRTTLDLPLAETDAETDALINGYANYYRFYPQYVQSFL